MHIFLLLPSLAFRPRSHSGVLFHRSYEPKTRSLNLERAQEALFVSQKCILRAVVFSNYLFMHIDRRQLWSPVRFSGTMEQCEYNHIGCDSNDFDTDRVFVYRRKFVQPFAVGNSNFKIAKSAKINAGECVRRFDSFDKLCFRTMTFVQL